MKKIIFLVLAVFLASVAQAAVEDIVKQLLPDSDLSSRSFMLTDRDIEKANAALGDLAAIKGVFEAYLSKSGVVIIESAEGKHGPITLAVLIDINTRKVKNVVIISMSERRGAAIKRNFFIKQFFGKGDKDPMEPGRDIKAVAGATVSSRAVIAAVKQAVVIYGILADRIK